MRRTITMICILVLALAAGAPVGDRAFAGEPDSAAVKQAQQKDARQVRMCTFIDEDGDGFNDLAPDRDGDGIPDRFDPDTRKQGKSGKGRKTVDSWFRFARLFQLLVASQQQQGTLGSGDGMGPSGLGDGPGPRTGFGSGAGGTVGDDADLGGRSQRRGGHR